MTSNPCVDSLNDSALLNQFGDLVRRNREQSAQLLRHIDIIDQRKLWAKLGHPSMFDFLVVRYHMSEATAGKRIGAARAARNFPILFGMVARGEIHLSGIHRLKAHLTPENHEQMLADAKHKTIRQIEELVARLAPEPDVRTSLRALPNRGTAAPTPGVPPPAAAALAAVAPALPMPLAGAPVESLPETAQPEPAPLPRRRDPDPVPLAPDRYKLQVTVSGSTRDKLKQLQDLLAHQIPNGDPAAIIERALDALLVQVHKRKTGVTDKPRAPKNHPAGRRTRHLKAAVRREVWSRDDGRCGFVGEDGHRCNETRGLEFAHVQPWAKGGADTTLNLGLRCAAHNALEADRDYGTRFMANKRRRKPLKVREPLAGYGLRGPQVAIDRMSNALRCLRGARQRTSEAWPRS